MSEENKTQNENELTENELDQVAGGASPQLAVPTGQDGILIGLLLPAAQKPTTSSITDGTSNTLENSSQKVFKP